MRANNQLKRISYLRSPIVELILGQGENTSVLHAHQAVLTAAPFFAEACAQFSESAARRRIELQQDDEAATASVLEYLYKNDYFPALQGTTNMEYDPTVPSPDNDGIGLLRHARVYTLAQKFGLPQLAALAHKKIHLTQSTAKGEIAYARFVYKETSIDDESIRKPVAAFWATRSHVLRHEAEHEFKRMCLEFPQFGFDVLSLVLDAQEKRSQRQEGTSAGPGRKRQRVNFSCMSGGGSQGCANFFADCPVSIGLAGMGKAHATWLECCSARACARGFIYVQVYSNHGSNVQFEYIDKNHSLSQKFDITSPSRSPTKYINTTFYLSYSSSTHARFNRRSEQMTRLQFLMV